MIPVKNEKGTLFLSKDSMIQNIIKTVSLSENWRITAHSKCNCNIQSMICKGFFEIFLEKV